MSSSVRAAGRFVEIIGLAALITCGASGCKSNGNTASVDISVEVDSALSLQTVLLQVASGVKQVERNFSPSPTLHWIVVVSNPTKGQLVTASAQGIGSGGTSIVSYSVLVSIGPGETVPVQLKLSAACSPGPVCTADENCDDGVCKPRPTVGLPDVDAGSDARNVQTDGGSPDAPDGMPAADASTACPTGQHPCSGMCVQDDDPETCGTSCTPCAAPTGGSATCDGTKCGGSCPSGQQLCSSACIAETATCSTVCPTGSHACSGLCSSNQDEYACGTSCAPCPVPAGALQATCDGTNCGFVCATGYHQCGATCAKDTDATACGATCLACAGDPNGAAQCVSGTCALACNTGYHVCNGKCASNTDTGTCGASCTPCQTPTGGTATCTAGQCGGTCPTNKLLCNGACIDPSTPCSNQCPTGSHNCSGICSSNTAVNSCGTLCTSCPVPTGATSATCDGAACGLTCGTGYHLCGSRCATDSDATACGTACMACPPDPNGTASCQNGVCGIQCKTGYHACAGSTAGSSVCVSSSALATCGPAECKTPCPVPTGGTATCNGLACGTSCPSGTQLCSGACISTSLACNGTCPSGQHNCSGVCAVNASPSTCGTRCSPCAAPAANGAASCDGTSCGVACSSGYRNCSGTTTCVSSTGGCCAASDCTAGGAHTTATCSANVCSYPCASGYKSCNGACIASASCCTNADCSATVTACSNADTCSNGTCQPNNLADGPQPNCNSQCKACSAGTCTTLTSGVDPSGTCPALVGIAPTCATGMCTTGGACATGPKVSCLTDADGDGWGAGAAMTKCGSACPAKTVVPTAGGDCNDANFNVHPGQTEAFPLPIDGNLDNDTVANWDYNCNGKLDLGPEFDFSVAPDALCSSSTACALLAWSSDLAHALLHCGQLQESCTCVDGLCPNVLCGINYTADGMDPPPFTCY